MDTKYEYDSGMPRARNIRIIKWTWVVLQDIFLSVLDVILPEKERAARVRNRTIADFVLCPTVHELRGEHIITLLNYKDAGVSDLVRALKYEQSNHAAGLCALALADYLREEVSNMRTFSPKQILIMPVPLHRDRVRERGFNQVEKVLSRLPEDFKNGQLSTLTTNTLQRTRATPQQTRLSRSDRLKNVSGAFEISSDSINGTHVILIDDVTTTGATLTSAARPLRKNGAQVTLIALARA